MALPRRRPVDLRRGLHLADTQFAISDSTFTDNRRGVYVTGENTGVRPPECRIARAPEPRWARSPTTWFYDPIFLHCDIFNNEEMGVLLDSPQFVQIRKSNIVDNGSFGVQVDAHHIRNLNEEEATALRELIAGVDLELVDNNSHIRNKIIIRNNRNGQPETLPEYCDAWGKPGDEASGEAAPCVTTQVDVRHVEGTLDLTGNWWGFTSDRGGALEGAYDDVHTDCPNGVRGREWNSPVDRTNFAFAKIEDAGPREVKEPVAGKRKEAQQRAGLSGPLPDALPSEFPQ